MANVEDAKARFVRWAAEGYVYWLPNWVASFSRSSEGGSWSPIHARSNYHFSDEPKEEWEKGHKGVPPSEDAQGGLGRSKSADEVP